MRRIEIGQALASKVQRHKNPWLSLQLSYGAQKGKLFNEEEDRFLVCMTHHLGYGRWEELRDEVRKCWLFRFDWFIKTRSPLELQRRVDVLIRLIEKENAEIAEAEAEAARKRKKEGGGAKAKKVRRRRATRLVALRAAARRTPGCSFPADTALALPPFRRSTAGAALCGHALIEQAGAQPKSTPPPAKRKADAVSAGGSGPAAKRKA